MSISRTAALALSMAFAAPALAEVTVVGGTIVAGDTFNRPFASTPPGGLSGVGTAVYYDVYSFTVTADGDYSIAMDSAAFDPFLVLYAGAFDPTQPLLNGISADDDSGPGVNSLILASLMAGPTYVAVMTTFSNGETGAYTLTFDGPGSIVPADGGVIPEPATWAMLIAGFGLVGGALRRRRVAALAG